MSSLPNETDRATGAGSARTVKSAVARRFVQAHTFASRLASGWADPVSARFERERERAEQRLVRARRSWDS